MLNWALLVVGFLLLVKGADWLVSGSSTLARRMGVSELVVGLTVVAFGTSAPELFVNIFASAQGNAGIAIGNVLGSNIFNTLLILGVASVIYPLAVTKGTVWKEIPFSLLAVLVLGALANDALFDHADSSCLGRIDGFVFIAFFAIFLYYIMSIAKVTGHPPGDGAGEADCSLSRSIIRVTAGLASLVTGGKLVVDGAVGIATHLGISETLIGFTIVAAGTSLPELATSAVAAYRKKPDIAIGNIVGSNIFNIFFILGISTLIRPLPVTAQVNFDIFVLAGASLLLFFFMFIGKKHHLEKRNGIILVLLYLTYLAFIVKRG
ncbi:MAG: calcium/sodium antiporter [Candidatus Krumholzibacteria bacterium]|jgi:cation:H+ antiporter|nr:calcium/sodium antiporter [Candidatus Krumholzibacteria bacterium]